MNRKSLTGAAGRTASWFPLVLGLMVCRPAAAAPFVPARDAHCVALSPDGKFALVGYSGPSNAEFPPRPHPNPRKAAVLQLFDLAARKRLRRVETFGDLTQVAFSPDGSSYAACRLFTTSEGIELNEVRVFDTATGQVQLLCDRCQAFSFSPAGDEIVVASRKRCVAYRLATGEKTKQFSPLANALNIHHAPNGSRLLGIAQSPSGFTIRAVDVPTGELQGESPPLADPFYWLAIPAMAPSWTAGQLATGHLGGEVLLWDPATLRPVSRLRTGGPGRAHPFFSPDGQLLAAADQLNSDVVFWEIASGKELARYTFKQGTLHTHGSRSAARTVRPEEDPARFVFSADGASFFGGPYGGILRLVANGQDLARFGE